MPFPCGAFPAQRIESPELKVLEAIKAIGGFPASSWPPLQVRISRRLAWALASTLTLVPGHTRQTPLEVYDRMDRGEVSMFGFRVVVKPHLRLVA